MNGLRDRLLVTVAAISLLAAAGTVAGYFIGRNLAIQHARAHLEPYARRVLTQADAAVVESRATLSAVAASSFPACSDPEIGWLRQLTYRSEFIKDAGRIAGGKIVCSAALGRQAAIPLPQPEFSRKDGTRVFLDLDTYRIPGQHVLAIQLGDAFVVYNPYSLQVGNAASMHLTLTGVDKLDSDSARAIGSTPRNPALAFAHDSETRVNDTMYLTRCSASRFGCITAFISIPEALQAYRGEFRTDMAMGGLGGALFGLAVSILFRRNKAIDKQLRRAIRREGINVVYQPIVELQTGTIVGAEALARWTDEDGFIVSPEVFIPIAEDRGFVGDITRLVVKHCLRDFAHTMQMRPGFRVNFNIAASDLSNPRLLRTLERYLRWAGIPASALGIEVTESGTARHQVAKDTIAQLRKRGHVVHIDDFGTGYSSLARLNDLSVDAIKIDRAFTHAIGTEAVTVSILPQILSMAESLNLKVIVEGIETAEQAAFFSSSRLPLCAQGWLFGRPVSAEDFHLLLADQDERLGIHPVSEEETALALPAGAS